MSNHASDQLILWTIVALAPLAILFAIWRIVTGPRLISKLMLRYLMKRRIAWVSLIAVMLCTAMVIIVISVMGGWLRMFRQTNHDLIGDLIVYRGALDGFAHYDDMLAGIRKIPDVQAATATVRTLGLAEIGTSSMEEPIHAMVEVEGLNIKEIGQVNGFVNSLYLTKDRLLEKAKYYEDQSRKEASTGIPGVGDEDAANAAALEKKAADFPSFDKPFGNPTYQQQGFKGNAAIWPGIIVGSGVIALRGNSPRPDYDYLARVKLTIVKASDDSAGTDVSDRTASANFWLCDDSHTNVFQVDQNTVYLPFDYLQKQLAMDEQPGTNAITGKPENIPARCSEILIKVKTGADPHAVQPQVQHIVDDVCKQYGLDYTGFGQLKVETWDEHQRDFLSAVEHEESLLVILFAIISVVAIFLIFCIFFMIVMEKTRDIGIIKSVGATGATVASIFLGYGLCIGLVGGGMGLLMAYLVVHNINQLHSWMAAELGVEIWNAKTYLFDTIPNTMIPRDVAIIVSVAVLSSVLGALLPAIRAARMNPIDALRWE